MSIITEIINAKDNQEVDKIFKVDVNKKHLASGGDAKKYAESTQLGVIFSSEVSKDIYEQIYNGSIVE